VRGGLKKKITGVVCKAMKEKGYMKRSLIGTVDGGELGWWRYGKSAL